MDAGGDRWHSGAFVLERRAGARRPPIDGGGAARMDFVARSTAARHRAAARRGASQCTRSVSLVRRDARCRADAMECRALASSEATAVGDRARLRRARVARAPVDRAIRLADVDDRAAPIRGADTLCSDVDGANDTTRTEDHRDAHRTHGAWLGSRYTVEVSSLSACWRLRVRYSRTPRPDPNPLGRCESRTIRTSSSSK